MLVWFLPLFLIFLLIGLPVFFSLLAAPGILLWLNGQARADFKDNLTAKGFIGLQVHGIGPCPLHL